MADQSYNFVPSHLAVQAMRDNGYKNAAYALAELMDNAIQAGATQVELLCGERKQQVKQQKRSRIEQVAVLDNGCGMNADILRLALQFGNGTYLEEEKHTGIGRFGMGLPSSSISQCQRVDVWSWQHGMENALYTYLDLEEIKSQKLTEVPEPQYKPIPSIWEKVGNSFGQSGTLVVWSQIDRCLWKTGKAIIENSELLIGRMYRKFLHNNQVSIRMLSFDLDNPRNIILEKEALPNDPMYLMANTSCPKPFSNEAMFQLWEDQEGQHEITFTIEFQDKKHEVIVRFSYSRPEAREAPPGKDAGDLPHGKHAAKNVGISILRAGRELELDQSLVQKYQPRERWWGVEIEFPPSLDDLFGVTNNKQSARNLTDTMATDIESLLEGGKTIAQLKDELKENEDPRAPFIEITKKIQKVLGGLRSFINNQRKGSRSKNNRHGEYKIEQNASAITNERKDNGYYGKSDKDESLPKEQRQSVLEDTFTNEYNMTTNQAKELAVKTVNDNIKYVFQKTDLDTPAFFSVKSKAGSIIVTLNTNHPVYSKLVEVLEDDNLDETDIEKLRSRLTNAHQGLELLLLAWARHEDEQPEGKRQEQARDTRVDWGRMARLFLENQE